MVDIAKKNSCKLLNLVNMAQNQNSCKWLNGLNQLKNGQKIAVKCLEQVDWLKMTENVLKLIKQLNMACICIEKLQMTYFFFFARYIYALHDFVFNIASIMFLFCFCSVHLFLNLVMFLVTLFISQNLTDPVKLGLFNKQLWQQSYVIGYNLKCL